jgi:hypothetical protein
MADQEITFMVEDAQIIFRNFSGRESQYNREGDRNFCVILDPDTARQMQRDGWNIKETKGDEEEGGEPGVPYIQVAVGFKFKAPTIVVLTESTRTMYDEGMVGSLDWAEIKNVDLIARAYRWDVGGKSGIKAYLKSMYITIEEDALEKKYANVHPAG